MVRRGDVVPMLITAPSVTVVGKDEKETQAVTETSSETTSTQKHATATATTHPVVTSTTAFPSALNGNNPGNDTSMQTPGQ